MNLLKAKEIISDEISNICDSELSEAWGTISQAIDALEKSERKKELKKYLDENEYVTRKEVFEMIELSKKTYEYGLD